MSDKVLGCPSLFVLLSKKWCCINISGHTVLCYDNSILRHDFSKKLSNNTWERKVCCKWNARIMHKWMAYGLTWTTVDHSKKGSNLITKTPTNWMDRYRVRDRERERESKCESQHSRKSNEREREKGRPKKETHTHNLGKRGVKGFGPRFEWATDIPSTHTQHPSIKVWSSPNRPSIVCQK